VVKSLDTKEFEDDSILEEYTGTEFPSYTASSLGIVGDGYDYENLIPSFDESDWLDVNPNLDDSEYPSDLFKLFWYTAQKTQFYASDDANGNNKYRKSGDQILYNLSDLWAGEGYTSVSSKSAFFNGNLRDQNNEDFFYSSSSVGSANCNILNPFHPFCFEAGLFPTCYYCTPDEGPNIEDEAEAELSHAMRAVSGLYRLFWKV